MVIQPFRDTFSARAHFPAVVTKLCVSVWIYVCHQEDETNWNFIHFFSCFRCWLLVLSRVSIWTLCTFVYSTKMNKVWKHWKQCRCFMMTSIFRHFFGMNRREWMKERKGERQSDRKWKLIDDGTKRIMKSFCLLEHHPTNQVEKSGKSEMMNFAFFIDVFHIRWENRKKRPDRNSSTIWVCGWKSSGSSIMSHGKPVESDASSGTDWEWVYVQSSISLSLVFKWS